MIETDAVRKKKEYKDGGLESDLYLTEGMDGITSFCSILSIQRKMKLKPGQKAYAISYISLILAQLCVLVWIISTANMEFGHKDMSMQLDLIKKRQAEAAILMAEAKALSEEAITNNASNLDDIILQRDEKIQAVNRLTSQNSYSMKTIQQIAHDIDNKRKIFSPIRLITIYAFFVFIIIWFVAKRVIIKKELKIEPASTQDADKLRL